MVTATSTAKRSVAALGNAASEESTVCKSPRSGGNRSGGIGSELIPNQAANLIPSRQVMSPSGQADMVASGVETYRMDSGDTPQHSRSPSPKTQAE